MEMVKKTINYILQQYEDKNDVTNDKKYPINDQLLLEMSLEIRGMKIIYSSNKTKSAKRESGLWSRQEDRKSKLDFEEIESDTGSIHKIQSWMDWTCAKN